MSFFGLFGPPNIEKLKAKGNIKGLIEALRERRVREAAIEALVEIGVTSVEPLVTALKDLHHVEDVRKGAAEALGRIGDERAIEPLIAALKDKEVCQTATKSLVKIGAPTVQSLVATLNDKDACEAIIEILAKIGTPAIKPLVAALNDSNKDIRNIAAQTLDYIGWQPDCDKTGAIYWIVKGNWNKCIEIGAPAVKPLAVALKDSNKNVRKAAVTALAKIGNPQAAGSLIVALKDSESEVQWAAIEALGKIGIEEYKILADILKLQKDRERVLVAIKEEPERIRRAEAELDHWKEVGDRVAVGYLELATESNLKDLEKELATLNGKLQQCKTNLESLVSQSTDKKFISYTKKILAKL